MESYWCHTCKSERDVEDDGPEVVCVFCRNPFVEQVHTDEEHPRTFVPYQPVPSLNQFLSELMMSPAVRSVRYISAGMQGLLGVQENPLEQIIHQLMMNDTNRYGPPPAAEDAVNRLPGVLVTHEIIERQGSFSTPVDDFGDKIGENKRLIECTVCKDEFNIGDEGVSMPCSHLFHRECITPWLKAHNSCPTCRFELPTDDADYEQRRRRP